MNKRSDRSLGLAPGLAPGLATGGAPGVARALAPAAPTSPAGRVVGWALGAFVGCALLVAGCAGGNSSPPPATCGVGLSTCGGTCINTGNNASNCGSCGHACMTGQVCDNGNCTSTCSASTRLCGNSCADFTTDLTNCGGCGTVCRADQICNGACACAPGKVLCNGVCATSCAMGTGGSGPGTGGSGPGTGGNPGTGGGPGTGGRATGGAIGTGGMIGGTGGMIGGTGGVGGVAGTPGGYYTMGTFHGCTWTGVDILAKGTMNTPADFVSQTPAGFPYCVSGSVGADPLNSATVALLGFDLNEAPNGMSTQCASKPGAAAPVLPAVNVTTAGANPPGGIAISYVRKTGSNIRVQLQGPNGATDPNARWCATITQVQGPVFLPFSAFNTACYNNSGAAYMGQPISEISLLVPGTTGPSPFSYCVGGFALGSTVTSATAAPAYTPNPYPILTGMIGGPDPSGGDFIDLQRVKVAAPGVNGKAYIVQNNNWGSPTTSDQTITYSANTFTVVSSTGNTTGVGIPGSFPSIYIGANGQTAGLLPGVLSTTPDNDGLPKAISAITTMPSTFAYNKATGDYNATYDIWVSSVPTLPLGYKTAQSGFVMVWLYRPPGRSPISATGTAVRTATIGGVAYSVFVGPRNEAGGDGTNRPVVSYVANTTMLSTPTNFDLKPFLADAAMNGIPSNWVVTDVFAGFEIWTGSSAAGLSETAFSIAVN